MCKDCTMDMDYSTILIGIGPWLIVPGEPRHNTFHMELKRIASTESINLIYFGLREMPEQKWMCHVLPNSTLRKYTAISPKKIGEISKILTGLTSQHKTIYIFEGSISWFITLNILAAKSGNTTVICNLFPSGKYEELLFRKGLKSILFRSALLAVSRISRQKAVITFDTKLMSDKVQDSVGIYVEPFPVPSSFGYKVRNETTNKHSRVLINIRGFDSSKLHPYLEKACQDCRFVVPKGLIVAGIITYKEFGKYPNLEFDEKNISEEEYAEYIDSFDYLIILYEPTVNASGKILDAITRGVPVAVPKEASEWAQISKSWGKHHLFGWQNSDEEARLFQHPKFLTPTSTGEPPFTPRNSIKTLARISKHLEARSHDNSIFKDSSIYLWSALYYFTCTILNYQYSLRMKLLSFFIAKKI